MSKLIVLFSFFSLAFSQVNQLLVSSNSRAMGMGGSFTAVADPTNSVLWNPAINIINKNRQHGQYRQFGIFDIDVLPASIMIVGFAIDAALSPECEEDDSCDEDEEYDHSALDIVKISLPYVFRGGSFYGDNYYIQLKLNEDLADFDFEEKFDPYDNSQNLLSFAYQFGREWAIGYSQVYYVVAVSENESLTGFGHNIGIAYNALKIKGLSYGLTYFNMPNNMKSVRAGSERLIEKSVNFGLSYKGDDYIASLDIRNLFNSENDANKEVHVGLEYSILRLGGYFYNNETEKFVPSFGLGYVSNPDGNLDSFFYRLSFSYTNNEERGLKNLFTFSSQVNF